MTNYVDIPTIMNIAMMCHTWWYAMQWNVFNKLLHDENVGEDV